MTPPITLRVAHLAAALLLAPGFVRAQGTTADGVQAILRGDYQSAVRILRPLAEGSDSPDPLAQFFMGALYDAGHGVPRDSIRACGLYVNAAASNHPLMAQSLDLARFFKGRDGNIAFARFCDMAAASRSLPLAPTSFALASDHSVTIDDEGATVKYKATEQHTAMRITAGVVSLPPRLTSLEVSRPVAARRNFIRYFVWVPDPNAEARWALGWMLFEIVGSDFVQVTGDPAIAIVAAARPPGVFDVDALARIGVNANGEAEWTVSGGSNPRRGVVPFKEAR